MSNIQLSLGGLPSNNEREHKVGKVRFTVTLPTDVSIKLDMAREKSLHSRNDWILMAIKEKLVASEENDLQNIMGQLLEIKDMLKK